jgi:hypothetical protein
MQKLKKTNQKNALKIFATENQPRVTLGPKIGFQVAKFNSRVIHLMQHG